MYNVRISGISLYIVKPVQYRLQRMEFILISGVIALTVTAKDESMCSVHDDPTERAFPMH